MCYSFGGGSKRNFYSGTHNPGPGSYQSIIFEKYKAPKWKFGSSQREFFNKNINPGPGSYNSQINFSSQKNPLYSFGLKLDNKDYENIYKPGPGKYENIQNPKIQFSPKYSFGLKSSSKLKNFVPGPGSYNYQSSLTLNASKFGTSQQRMNLSNTIKVPGPGSYNAQERPKSANPKYGFGTSQKSEFLKDQKFFPGPGTYEFDNSLKGKSWKGFSFGSKLNIENKEMYQNPGPGAYQPVKIQSKSSIKIGCSQRNITQKFQTPGPGSYQQRIFIDKPHSPDCKIGSSTREIYNKSIKNPGPGTYQIPEKSIEGPKYGFGSKLQSDKFLQNPGPGSYNAIIGTTKERPASAAFGRETRESFKKLNQQVGPGQYNISKGIIGPKFGFGTSQRIFNEKTISPGPGAYNVPQMWNQVPKYLLNKF